MMNENPQSSLSMPLGQRLSVKLILLFAATFLLGFFALWAYGLVDSYRESRAAEAGLEAQPKQMVIDPNIQDELTQVLALDALPLPPDVRDPFNDRTGISGLTAQNTGGSSGTSADGGSLSGGSPAGGRSSGGSSGGAPPSSEPEITALEATKQRYERWAERARIGIDVELDPMIFAIDDLLPVGIVDGGSGRQEVMFFSQAANRTVSFPVGTLFYDGWLTELRPEGVVFSFTDDRRTVRLRSWGRSIRPNS
jgi:hypothetical protein